MKLFIACLLFSLLVLLFGLFVLAHFFTWRVVGLSFLIAFVLAVAVFAPILFYPAQPKYKKRVCVSCDKRANCDMHKNYGEAIKGCTGKRRK